jgi:NaMN:DMB phosphoribosyltransferase
MVTGPPIKFTRAVVKTAGRSLTMKDLKTAMEEHLDWLTKPRGSLGKLETYCVKMAEIQRRVPPEINKRGIYVFAGDHGIASCGVSLYPQEVTRQRKSITAFDMGDNGAFA